MSQQWPYSKMSHEASLYGGPELWIKKIKSNAYNSGAIDTKNKITIPLIAIGVGIGILGTKMYQKFSLKKEERRVAEQEALEAEIELKQMLDSNSYESEEE